MEKLIHYVEYPWALAEDFVEMAKNRASRGAKLSSVMLVTNGGYTQRDTVLKLKEYVTQVEDRAGGIRPAWDDVPGANREESEWFAK